MDLLLAFRYHDSNRENLKSKSLIPGGVRCLKYKFIIKVLIVALSSDHNRSKHEV
jgi:hypothetical protein